jgi:hypothetical protein
VASAASLMLPLHQPQHQQQAAAVEPVHLGLSEQDVSAGAETPNPFVVALALPRAPLTVDQFQEALEHYFLPRWRDEHNTFGFSYNKVV